MQKLVVTAIETIDEDSWVDIDGYIGARAQVAETVYGGRRLIVRRTLNECPSSPHWLRTGATTRF